MIQDYSKSRTVIDFLDSYSTGTKNSYKSFVCNYFKWIKIEPDKYIKLERDFGKDVVDYVKNSSKKRAPLGRKQEMVGIKQFLEYHDIEIKPRIWKTIRNRNKAVEPSTEDKILENHELKKVLQFADIKGKTMFLLVTSSGIRINELVSIKWDDVDFQKRSIFISAEVAKNNRKRTTYFTEEAKDALIEWKRVAPIYSERAKNRTYKSLGIKKKSDNGRIFPYTTATVGAIWNNLLVKAGEKYVKKDPRTNRRIYHLYTLRKFFDTRMKESNMPEAVVLKLMGHKGYLNTHYDRFSEKYLKRVYDENCKVLSVFSELYKIDEIIKPKLEHHDTVISSITRDNVRLKEQVIELQQQSDVKELQNQMIDMQDKVNILLEVFTKSEWYMKQKLPFTKSYIEPYSGIEYTLTLPSLKGNGTKEEIFNAYRQIQVDKNIIKNIGFEQWTRKKRDNISSEFNDSG